MKKIKAYIECIKLGEQSYNCTMIFENGAAMFAHLCSHPGYAFGDLWGNRRERQAVLNMMGYTVEVAEEMNKIPKKVEERYKDHESYQAFVDEYNQFKKELKKDKE